MQLSKQDRISNWERALLYVSNSLHVLAASWKKSLSSSSTPSKTVDINLYRKIGDDFEFILPKCIHLRLDKKHNGTLSTARKGFWFQEHDGKSVFCQKQCCSARDWFDSPVRVECITAKNRLHKNALCWPQKEITNKDEKEVRPLQTGIILIQVAYSKSGSLDAFAKGTGETFC